MIVGGQTEARAQLSSTIIDYHEPFDQGFNMIFYVVASVYRFVNFVKIWNSPQFLAEFRPMQ